MPPAARRLRSEALRRRSPLRRLVHESLERRWAMAGNVLSGFVYLDANGDGQRGATESGVPGVMITLAGQPSSGSYLVRTAYTGDDGGYSFNDVPNGVYSLVERQPTALEDGLDSSPLPGAVVTNDQLSGLAVSGDQTFANNNFGERRLLGPYIHLGWFFASNVSGGGAFRESVGLAERAAGDERLAETILADEPPATATGGGAAPTGVADSYSIAAGGTLSVAASAGVLKNDSDPDGQTLSAVLVSAPARGVLTLQTNGGFVYTPNPGYSGSDSFQYVASDGSQMSAPATVSLLVTGTNGAPTAANDAYAVDQDGVLSVATATGLLANDVDPEGNSLVAQLASNPLHGAVVLDPAGGFTYTPTAGYSGADSFTYRAKDQSGESNAATVSITVRPAPVGAADSYSVNQNATLDAPAATGVLANDTSSGGGPLTATLVAQAAHGVVTLNADGSFRYVPTAGYFGPDSFTYRASRGSLTSAVVTASINVVKVNQPPTAAANSYTTAEDAPLVVNVASGVLSNDADSDGDSLTAARVSGPSHGVLQLNADGSFTYTPAADYNGPDSFVYSANDGTVTTNATVSLTVTPVNDPPVATDDRYAVATGGALAVPLATGVLANDTDPDAGDILTVTVHAQPTHGALTLNADGSFSYTPTAGFSGTDTFQYLVSDIAPGSDCELICGADGSIIGSDGLVHTDIGTVTIDVNGPPVAVADAYTTSEDSPLIVAAADGLLKNDSDAEGNPLVASVVTGPSHGVLQLNGNGSFTYTPAANYAGADSFTYRVNDGFHNSVAATVALTVTAVDDPPQTAPDLYTLAGAGPLVVPASGGVLANDSDPEARPLVAVLETAVSNGSLTLNSDGSFSYQPTAGFRGTATFSYRAGDGAMTSAVTQVTIQVNAAPVAVADAYSTAEDSTLTVPVGTGVLANDTDADGDTLTATVVAGPAHGQLTLQSNGSFVYTPTADYHGPDSFTYRARDGRADSAVATVSLTVTPQSDPPVAAHDSYSATEDQVLTVPAGSGVLANDSDPDGGSLVATLTGSPSHGTVTLGVNGGFTYTPASNYAGVDTFKYRASDGTTNSNEATVTLTIAAVNDAPIARADSYNVAQNSTLNVPAVTGVLANDSDPEGGTLTAALVGSPAHGAVTLNANGSFTYTPAANYAGADSFTYRASDGSAVSATTTVSLQVASTNTFFVSEDAADGQVLGTVTPPVQPGATRLYDFVTPTLAADLQLAADDHLVGDRSASVVLIEYLDIQCPPCALYHPTVRGLEDQFDGELLVVRRHLPLTSIHPNAFEAAQAAEAAHRQGRFDEFINLAYTNQSSWSSLADPTPTFETYATSLGLNLAQFRSDMADPAIAARVQRDMDAAQRLGVNATPTFFLNGARLTSPPSSLSGFSAVIQNAVNQTNPVFEIDRSTGQLRLADGSTLNASVTPSYTLNLRVRDTAGLNQTFTVTVVVQAGQGEGEAPDSPTDSTAPLRAADEALAADVDWLADAREDSLEPR